MPLQSSCPRLLVPSRAPFIHSGCSAHPSCIGSCFRVTVMALTHYHRSCVGRRLRLNFGHSKGFYDRFIMAFSAVQAYAVLWLLTGPKEPIH